MQDANADQFLGTLRKAVANVSLYPSDHPYTRESLQQAVAEAAILTEEEGSVVISLVDDAFYLNKRLLPQSSLEQQGLIVGLAEAGIESLTFAHPVSASDLEELALFLAGTNDVPAEGTITLNERPFTRAELLEAATMSNIRRSYASSIDVLRALASTAAGREQLDMDPAVTAVESLLDEVLNQQGASLLLASLKTHDEYSFFHCVNTCILSLTLGRAIYLDDDQLLTLGVGALLHDIGKVRVPISTIRHPGRLDDHQWDEIKLHPQEGAQAILAASGHGQEVAARVALEHHARFDLSGYPVIRRGQLHLFSRIVTVADVYDAMTTRRSYKRAEPPNRALQVLVNGIGTLFDPDLVRAFVSIMGIYPVGSLLQVNTGELVMVVNPGDELTPPVVIPLRDAGGAEVTGQHPRDLDVNSIVELLLPEQAGVAPAALAPASVGD